MDQIRKFNLREPRAADRKLDFDTYHDLVMAVARTLGIGLPKGESPTIIRMIELDEDLPAYNEDGEADAETGNLPHIDKTGTVCYYNETDQLWKRDESQQKVTVCNPYAQFSYSKGTRCPYVYLAQAGKFVPLAGTSTKARKIMVTADAAFSGGATFAAHVVEWDDPDIDPDPDDKGIVVRNPHSFSGAEGSRWECDLWPTHDYYSAIQGVCES